MKERIGLAALKGFERPLVLAIGVFDGVHLGHRKVIERCIEEARRIIGVSAVLTFHPHPAKVVRPQSAPPLLTTEEQDRALFADLGVELCVTIDFDDHVRALGAVEFLNHLLKACPTLRTIVVGSDWHFGRGRDGNFAVLKQFCDRRGLDAVEVPPVEDESGEVISSTRVRKLVSEGRLAEAARLLGRPYAITARVVRGEGRGKELGFPTANLETLNEIIPPAGVYAVRVRAGGSMHAGAMNIGVRPTFGGKPGEKPVLEVHLLDFSGKLPGVQLEVEFVRRLRDEKKFPGPSELKAQIRSDVEEARRALR